MKIREDRLQDVNIKNRYRKLTLDSSHISSSQSAGVTCVQLGVSVC